MITVIATIKPEHLGNIRSRRKSYEMRKTAPAAGAPFRVLCCESGSGGMIKAEFVCDKVYRCNNIHAADGFVRESCVTMRQAEEYAAGKSVCFWHILNLVDYDQPKKVTDFYRPGTLSSADFEYQLYDGSGDPRRRSYASYLLTQAIRRPPQSWCYVEEVQNGK